MATASSENLGETYKSKHIDARIYVYFSPADSFRPRIVNIKSFWLILQRANLDYASVDVKSKDSLNTKPNSNDKTRGKQALISHILILVVGERNRARTKLPERKETDLDL